MTRVRSRNKLSWLLLLVLLVTMALTACGGEEEPAEGTPPTGQQPGVTTPGAEEETPPAAEETPVATVEESPMTGEVTEEASPEVTEVVSPEATAGTPAAEAPTAPVEGVEIEGPIRFEVPYDPGGGYDRWARLLAPYLSKCLPGNPNIVVENVPGAGGLLAANQLFTKEPDGRTIQIQNLTGLAAAQIGGAANFDITELTYLGRVATDPQVLYVSSTSDIDNIEELKQEAQDGPIKQAMTGFVSSEGVNTIILYDLFDIDYQPVMHEGNSEARLSIVRGDTTAGIGSLESALDMFQSGELKPILYIGEEKPAPGEPGHDEVQNVQTLEDLGYEQFGTTLSARRVIVAPPGMDQEIRDTYDRALQCAVHDPEFLQEAQQAEISTDPATAEESEQLATQVLDTFREYETQIREAMQSNQ